jgi:hypothetical protein
MIPPPAECSASQQMFRIDGAQDAALHGAREQVSAIRRSPSACGRHRQVVG